MDIQKKVNFAKAGLVVVLFYALLFNLMGCVDQAKIKSPFPNGGEWSPEEFGTTIMISYNTAYADYWESLGYSLIDGEYTKTREVNLTPNEKEYLRRKKDLLTKVWPLIKTYNVAIQLGEEPPTDLVSDIMVILTDIENLLID